MKTSIAVFSTLAMFAVCTITSAQTYPHLMQPHITYHGETPVSQLSGVASYDLYTKDETLAPGSASGNPATKLLAQGSQGGFGSGDTEAMLAGRQNGRIFGSDNRQWVHPTTGYPWSTVCKIYYKFNDGSVYVGSGTLIAAKYVLTAGHCVYYGPKGGWIKSMTVVPGLDGYANPFGYANATAVRTYYGWTNQGNLDYDIGLVTLDRPIGNLTGWQGYAYIPSIVGLTVNSAGYPVDRGNARATMFMAGKIALSSAYTYWTQIDLTGGQDGGAIWVFTGGNRYAIGNVSWESTQYNGGPRITSARFNDIKSWIASGH